MEAEVAEQADHIARPADRDDRGGKAIFEQQQRAHHPGGELADGRIAVGVGRAGHRQGRGELGVAQAGKGADDAGDHVGDQHRRAGVERGGVAGADEDAGADDAADAEEDQVPRPERALELAGPGFFLDLGDALAQPDAPEKAPARCRSRHSISPRICCCARSLAARTGQGNPLFGRRLSAPASARAAGRRRCGRGGAGPPGPNRRPTLASRRSPGRPARHRARPCRRRGRSRRSPRPTRVREKSSHETYGPLGITRMWVGASGLMSWKASACSSS